MGILVVKVWLISAKPIFFDICIFCFFLLGLYKNKKILKCYQRLTEKHRLNQTSFSLNQIQTKWKQLKIQLLQKIKKGITYFYKT